MPFSPEQVMNRVNRTPSASAVDLDNHIEGSNAADAESQRIDQWTSQKFSGNPRHQSSRDASFGFPAKGVKR